MDNSVIDYPLTIIVDNREGKIITELENTKPFTYTKENLDIGDFKFELGNKKIIIERKTVDDLISSIKDGRYKEQKCRLLNEQQNNSTIIYLIEGDIWKSKKFNSETLYSVVINTMIRDNIHVYMSKSIEHTVMFLTKIYKQMEKNKDIFIKEKTSADEEKTPTDEEDTSYAQYIKPNKKANITPKICFINQLRQIPGISYTIASTLAETYKNMHSLLTAPREEISSLKVNGRRLPAKVVDFL